MSDDLTMEWFSEVMDLREPMSVNTSGVSNQMFQVLPNTIHLLLIRITRL